MVRAFTYLIGSSLTVDVSIAWSIQTKRFFSTPQSPGMVTLDDNSAFGFIGRRQTRLGEAGSSSKTAKPFGKQEYWRDFYKQQSEDFSWYATYNDLEPFISEWIAPTDELLLPGVGCDSLLRDLYDAGYTKVAAFDYAAESIEYCKSQLLGDERNIPVQVADARNLTDSYESESFDAVVEKGTLDAVFLSGSTPAERMVNLRKSIRELQRVLRPGGIFWSLSGVCVDALVELSNEGCWKHWDVLADGSLYTTSDGYTSNNIDGTLMVWKKPDDPR